MMKFATTAAAMFAFAAVGLSAAPASAQSRDGQDRRIVVENLSGQTIMYVRGSPTSHSSFGADRIPNTVLADGQSVTVDFDSGSRECQYDLRVTLTSGEHIDRMNVNVCRLTHWTIGARSNTIR